MNTLNVLAFGPHPDDVELFCGGLMIRMADLGYRTGVVDLTRGDAPLAEIAPRGGYDSVLVDAPCSGLGTLGHRPDLLLRLRDEPARAALVAAQTAILATASRYVRSGGTLVYAVCTLTRDEGDDPVRSLVDGAPGRWEHVHFSDSTPLEEALERGRPARVLLRPEVHGTDGFVVHRLRRRH